MLLNVESNCKFVENLLADNGHWFAPVSPYGHRLAINCIEEQWVFLHQTLCHCKIKMGLKAKLSTVSGRGRKRSPGKVRSYKLLGGRSSDEFPSCAFVTVRNRHRMQKCHGLYRLPSSIFQVRIVKDTSSKHHMVRILVGFVCAHSAFHYLTFRRLKIVITEVS